MFSKRFIKGREVSRDQAEVFDEKAMQDFCGKHLNKQMDAILNQMQSFIGQNIFKSDIQAVVQLGVEPLSNAVTQSLSEKIMQLGVDSDLEEKYQVLMKAVKEKEVSDEETTENEAAQPAADAASDDEKKSTLHWAYHLRGGGANRSPASFFKIAPVAEFDLAANEVENSTKQNISNIDQNFTLGQLENEMDNIDYAKRKFHEARKFEQGKMQEWHVPTRTLGLLQCAGGALQKSGSIALGTASLPSGVGPVLAVTQLLLVLIT